MRGLAVLPADRQIRIVEREEPKIRSATEVKLRILEVGVCGTDREIVAFHYGVPPRDRVELILGHESLAEVVEVGSEVVGFEAGDLVVPMVRRPCSDTACAACRAGSQDFCFSGNFTERGIKEADGFLCDFVVDEARYMTRVPPSLRQVGVLVEPLTIAQKALRQVREVQERLPWISESAPRRSPHALVLGAGPIGLLGAMALIPAGFKTFVYSREPVTGAKAAIVRSIGGHYISAEEQSVEDLPAVLEHIDLVYEACGASRLAFETLPHLGANGLFIFTGVPGRKAPIEIDADRIMRSLVLKNQLVFGTVNAGKHAFDAAIRDLQAFNERWPDAVGSLITGRYRLGDYEEALRGRRGGIKNVIALA